MINGISIRWELSLRRHFGTISYNLICIKTSTNMSWTFSQIRNISWTTGYLFAESVSGLIRDRSCPETSWQLTSGRRRRRRRSTILTILWWGSEWILMTIWSTFYICRFFNNSLKYLKIFLYNCKFSFGSNCIERPRKMKHKNLVYNERERVV